MLDRFMDSYATWETTAQFNFAICIVGLTFLLTILVGIWLAFMWGKLLHYMALKRLGWQPLAGVPIAQVGDDHRVDLKMAQITTHGKEAESKLLAAARQTLTDHAEEDENGQHEPVSRPPARRLQAPK